MIRLKRVSRFREWPCPLAGLGKSKESVQLAAAAKAEWERIGADIHVRFWTELLDRFIGNAKEDLGAEENEKARNEGTHLTFEEAVARALQVEATTLHIKT